MADAKTVSPLLDEFSMGSPYSSHHGIVCCPAIHTVTKEKFILKHISIPESQIQVNAMLLTGACADQTAAQSYYEDMTRGLEEEIRLLDRLAQSRGFAPFFSHQSTPKENGEVGMDLWVLSPYRTTLASYTKRNTMTHLNAVNLGIDLCAALTLSRKAGYLYQDLKPENIFITAKRQFQLGDFGFLPLDHLTYATFPEKYRGPFTAPELFDDFGEMNATIDLYALGMVLYWVYNGGQGPFAESPDQAESRRLQGEALPPPAYADYEMAEIILKAAAFRPQDRWQSPEEMGQALVSYMQRNPVNDAIIAPPVVTPAVLDAEAMAPDTQGAAQAAQPAPSQPDQVGSEPQPSAESDSPAEVEAPPEPAAEPEPEPAAEPEPESPAEAEPLPAEEPRQEIPAEAPDAAQPEPADNPLQAMKAILSQEEPSAEDSAPAEPEEDEAFPQEEEQNLTAAPQDPELADILSRAESFLTSPSGEDTPEPDAAQPPAPPPQPEAPAEEEEAEAWEEAPRRRSWKGLIVFLSVLLVLAVLAVGAYFYYVHYYCVPLEELTVTEGSLDSFTVRLTTEADPSALHVSCRDTYGNTYEAPLEDGTATFTGLNSNTQYTVTVSIDGFHKLIGQTQTTYTTGKETEIVSLTGVTGPEDGSVILNFTLTSDGPVPEAWTLTYSAEGEEAQTRSFSGQSVTVTGLTVGKAYTFQLDGGPDIYLTGATSLTLTASAVVTAQNLRVTEHTGSALTLTWDEPAAPVTGWSVRCYDSADFDQTVTVDSCTATIEGISADTAYTVEVTAAGMSQNAWISITANPLSISECTIQTEDLNQITAAWTFTGDAPEGGWIFLYTHGNGETATEAIQTTEPTVAISTVLPNTVYSFQIQAADGSTVLNNTFTATTPEAPAFSQYGVEAANVFMATFPTPEDPDWATRDVTPENQTTQFTASDSIAFVLEATEGADSDDAEVETLILVRDAQGVPVDYYMGLAPWHTMWTNDKYLGQLERTPQTPGEYRLEIYFNRQLVQSMAFTITA